jgi:hypothetical protein
MFRAGKGFLTKFLALEYDGCQFSGT